MPETIADAIRDRLRTLIAQRGHSVTSLNRAMGKGNCWLGRKLNGRRALEHDDVALICKHLGVTWRFEVQWSIEAAA